MADNQTALADLQGSISDLGTSINSELSAVEALLTKPTGVSPDDIEAAVTTIRGLKATVDAETAKISAPATTGTGTTDTGSTTPAT